MMMWEEATSTSVLFSSFFLFPLILCHRHWGINNESQMEMLLALAFKDLFHFELWL